MVEINKRVYPECTETVDLILLLGVRVRPKNTDDIKLSNNPKLLFSTIVNSQEFIKFIKTETL